MKVYKLLEVDSRKRVTLGSLAVCDRYVAMETPNGSILLTPVSTDDTAGLRGES